MRNFRKGNRFVVNIEDVILRYYVIKGIGEWKCWYGCIENLGESWGILFLELNIVLGVVLLFIV